MSSSRSLKQAMNGHRFEIHHEDAWLFLNSLPSQFADLIFLDPPFNLGKKYDLSAFSDREDPDIYLGWLHSILRKSIDALSEGGALYLYHIPAVAIKAAAFLETKLVFRHWIAISMKNNFVRGDRLYPAHYGLLYFTKGKPKAFSRPKLKPTTCRHCGGLTKDYGGYRSIIEENGINLSDFWDDLSPVRHGTVKKRTSNELPLKLFERVMHVSGFPGGNYVDPFMGSGGGLFAANARHMNAFGCDASRATYALVKQQLHKSRA